MQAKTLLSKHYKSAIFLACTQIVFQFSILYQKVQIDKSICQSGNFSDDVLSVQKVLFGASSGVCYLYLCKYFGGSLRLYGGNFVCAYRTSLFICCLSALSGFMQYIQIFETTCEVWCWIDIFRIFLSKCIKITQTSCLSFNLRFNQRISSGSNHLCFNGLNGLHLFLSCFF